MQQAVQQNQETPPATREAKAWHEKILGMAINLIQIIGRHRNLHILRITI